MPSNGCDRILLLRRELLRTTTMARKQKPSRAQQPNQIQSRQRKPHKRPYESRQLLLSTITATTMLPGVRCSTSTKNTTRTVEESWGRPSTCPLASRPFTETTIRTSSTRTATTMPGKARSIPETRAKPKRRMLPSIRPSEREPLRWLRTPQPRWQGFRTTNSIGSPGDWKSWHSWRSKRRRGPGGGNDGRRSPWEEGRYLR
mmetsp:Transcript_21819/g.48950  ORF Transcript_21819/g.48950 Transcript_21819/m.48950 type:complete len:202 (-) Transcript_21819:616-1221(-)